MINTGFSLLKSVRGIFEARFIPALLVASSLFLASQTTLAAQDHRCEEGNPRNKAYDYEFGGNDSFVPWPWGKEIAFPWNQMHGTWKIESSTFTGYFSFKITSFPGEDFRQLQVTQLENGTCSPVASGSGYESNKVVRALLRNKQTDLTSVFLIRGFNTSDVPCLSFPVGQKEVFVVSVRDLGVQDSSHYMISKISPSLNHCPIEE